MSPRRLRLSLVLCVPLAFVAGSWHAQRGLAQQLASSDARLNALGDELERRVLEMRAWQASPAAQPAVGAPALVDEVKRQLQNEMGLLPIQLLRDRRQSFVELNTTDAAGAVGYGTAG